MLRNKSRSSWLPFRELRLQIRANIERNFFSFIYPIFFKATVTGDEDFRRVIFFFLLFFFYVIPIGLSSKILLDLFCFIYIYMATLFNFKVRYYIEECWSRNQKVTFAEFYFLSRSFHISLFLNIQFLRPTVTCFVYDFFCLLACIFQVTKRNQVNNERHFRSLKEKSKIRTRRICHVVTQ